VALARVLEEDDAGLGVELRDVPAIADALGAAAAGADGAGLGAGGERHGGCVS
jgi:hypothetical protein